MGDTVQQPEEVFEKKNEDEADEKAKDGENETTESSLVDDKRLFVMNLSYSVTHDELTELFGKYGKVTDVELPFGKRGRGPLGIGFVKFETAEAAISAFASLDKSYY